MQKIISLLKNNGIIVAILILAILIRFIGTNPGYSHYHSDEPILYGTAIDMIKTGNLDPLRFDYPGGSIYANFLAFKFFFIPLNWLKYYAQNIPQILDGTVHIPISKLEIDRIFHTVILGEKEIKPMFWGRDLTALFSVGNVFLLYILVKKLFTKDVALIAAFLLVFNFKQVVNSHIGLPDIYNSFFLLLSCIASVNLWKKPNKKNYLFAGISLGLSLSMKYQFFAYFPFALSHFYVSLDRNKINLKKFFNPLVIMAGVASVLVFMLLNPYIFIHTQTAIDWISGVSVKYGVGNKVINFFPLSYLYHIDFGPIEFIVALLGSVFALIKFPKKSLYIFSILLPFIFLFCYYSKGGFYIRNLIPVTPFLLTLAALVIYEICKKRKILYLIILPIIVFIPARNSIINSYYYTKGWNYNILSAWMYKNIPVGTVIAAHPFDPPTGSPDIIKTEFEVGGSYSLAEHKENEAEYALLNLDWAADNFYSWMFVSPKDLKTNWSKPLNKLRNTYLGLAAEEMFRYQVFSVTKPWQAPDSDLVLAKIPVWPKMEMSEIAFQNIISIKPGHLYQVKADLKSEKIQKERNGYIRIDFYDSEEINNVDQTPKLGLLTTVSARLYDTDKSVTKIISERAPGNSKFMVIRLQSDSDKPEVKFDNMHVFESMDTVDDITSKPPYIKQSIDLNLLYPNSHGNL